ncbi:MAG TPA: AmmeMemoRadiSam system radical SAM enzyme [Desulfobacterales bacterium]
MEAYLWEPAEEQSVRCNLCSHRCHIKTGKRGICGVRENREGVLNTLVYDKIIAHHIDPIEKKPLFHFFPGSLSYSVATVGCNFRCRFCQNADIAQMPGDRDGMILGERTTPAELVQAAVQGKCRSIAYTYTEPTIFFELAHDTARIARERGLKNVFVTNGYMTGEAVAMIRDVLDAANVDLKAFRDDYYRKQCKARLKHVTECLKNLKNAGIFVEVTTLIVPGLNDDTEELRDLADFLVRELGVETPWHISRFHPTYKLTDRPPTPVKTLLMARDIGLEAGLRYVYTGNVPGEDGEHTYCPECRRVVIERWGFSIRSYDLEDGRCRYCRSPIDGVGL